MIILILFNSITLCKLVSAHDTRNIFWITYDANSYRERELSFFLRYCIKIEDVSSIAQARKLRALAENVEIM